jgi:hypothetical protein
MGWSFFKNSDGLVLGADAEGEERRGEIEQFNFD